MRREEHSSLPRRVASADYDHILVPAENRFHRSCGVEEAAVLVVLVVFDRQLTVLCPRGHHHGASAHWNAAGESKLVNSIHLLDRHSLSRDCELNPKFQSLQLGTASELLSPDAGWKAKIVFVFGSCSRLASWSQALDDDSAEPFLCSINSGRKASDEPAPTTATRHRSVPGSGNSVMPNSSAS